MMPLTQRQQYAVEDKRSSLPGPEPAQHLQPDSVVVVLGVLYPSVLPQLVEASTTLDLAPPPPGGLDTRRQSVDVIFYDPLSSKRNDEEALLSTKCRKKKKSAGYVNHAEGQKAVARDLALLSLRKGV